jgi:hypothetical protein
MSTISTISLLLRRCCDCQCPLSNRDKFCPRCGTRQPRELRAPARAAFVGLALLGGIAHAQVPDPARDYPVKPVRVIVTFAPGGGTDLLAGQVQRMLNSMPAVLPHVKSGKVRAQP